MIVLFKLHHYFLTVISELYHKRLTSETEIKRLCYSQILRYKSGHWLDSLVDIQYSKSFDVQMQTFDILRRYSLTEARKERQTKHTGLNSYCYGMHACTNYVIICTVEE